MTDVADQIAFNPESAAVEPAAATAPEEKPKAVFVENLSSSVTTKTLNDFFSLCGTIETITLRPKAGATDGTLEAIVYFDSSAAADTAVLLTNAILVDRTITITYFKGESKNEEEKPKEGEGEKEPSVWASLLAATYKFSDDVRARASEVDNKYGVTKGFEETVDKIDQTLGITEKFNAMHSAVAQKSEELGVNQKMDAFNAGLTQAGQQIARSANAVFDSAMQNAYVSNAWTALSGWGSSLISGWTAISQEADDLYTKQTGNVRGAPKPSAEVPAEAAATTDADTVSVPTSAAQDEAKPAEKAPEASPEEVKMPAAPSN